MGAKAPRPAPNRPAGPPLERGSGGYNGEQKSYNGPSSAHPVSKPIPSPPPPPPKK